MLTPARPAKAPPPGAQLEGLASANSYEFALALTCSEALTALVGRGRAVLASLGLSGEILEPHLTLLYCGVMTGAAAEALRPALLAAAPPRLHLEATGYGAFQRDGRPSNLHVAFARSTELLACHKEALHRYSDGGFRIPTPYVGERYFPHVSLVDNIEGPMPPIEEVRAGLPAVRGRYQFGRPYLLGRIVG